MKLNKKIQAVFVLVFGLFLVHNGFSQTVVQWYTSMGDFRVQLREDLVPVTAQNFIDLTNDEFYDDLIFHRVIEDFMIQDGCPLGTGYGGPGYTFDDEFHPDLRHDQPGILSMANSGPNTNGSQYFITVVPTAWLDDVHAVFGKVMDGMEVVYAISEVETNSNNKPLIDVVIDSIRVVTGDPVIEVVSPLSGTKMNAANDIELAWNSAFVADVKIEFSSDNGQSWETIVDSYSAHYRSYDWQLPEVLSDECFIKISDAANLDVYGMNEEAFTLCNLDLLTPNGLEVFMNDLPLSISWESDYVDNINIYYQLEEEGDWFTIIEDYPSFEGEYIWYPDFSTNWCVIGIEENGYPEVFDMSDYRFFIYQLDLLAPLGGESLSGFSNFQIDWEKDLISSIRIEFSSDNGENWSLIESNYNASQTPYNWVVPNIDSDECYIKLSSTQNPELYKMNETPFSVSISLGLENHKSNTFFDIFPNPADEIVNVNISNINNEHLILEVIDVFGRRIKSHSIQSTSADKSIALNVAELERGVYSIVLRSGNTKLAKKMIVK